MTTEQMDWLDDEGHRKRHSLLGSPTVGRCRNCGGAHGPGGLCTGKRPGGTRPGGISVLSGVENTSAVEFPSPVQAGTISAFVDGLPADAVVKISPAMRVEGYRIEACW